MRKLLYAEFAFSLFNKLKTTLALLQGLFVLTSSLLQVKPNLTSSLLQYLLMFAKPNNSTINEYTPKSISEVIRMESINRQKTIAVARSKTSG